MKPRISTTPTGSARPRGAALWRRLSSRYEWLVARIVPQAEAFFDTCVSFVPQGGISVLELGCGTGYATERMLRRNPRARVTGLDLSEEMLAAAQAKAKLKRVRWVHGDIRGAWPDGRWEVVFTTLCLHHLTRPERGRVLERAREALRRGGCLINGDIFKPETRWEEALLRQRWAASLRAQGLSPAQAAEMIAKRRANMGCFDTLAEHRAMLEEAGFGRAICPWTCEMAGVWVALGRGR